jgi:coenzyme F420-reducing hydrogenase delta subunit
MATRYNEINCNAQCRACNRFEEGNKAGYRRGLVQKYGEIKILMLESQQVKTAKISVFEYEEMIKYYKEIIKSLLSNTKWDRSGT